MNREEKVILENGCGCNLCIQGRLDSCSNGLIYLKILKQFKGSLIEEKDGRD